MGEEERRRYLDEPYIVEQLALDEAIDRLSPLLRPGVNPLPRRLRAAIARSRQHLRAVSRELRLHPARVQAERDREEPPRPPRL
jgi:hypothetical protein